MNTTYIRYRLGICRDYDQVVNSKIMGVRNCDFSFSIRHIFDLGNINNSRTEVLNREHLPFVIDVVYPNFFTRHKVLTLLKDFVVNTGQVGKIKGIMIRFIHTGITSNRKITLTGFIDCA